MLPRPTDAPAVHKYTEIFDDQAAAGRVDEVAAGAAADCAIEPQNPTPF